MKIKERTEQRVVTETYNIYIADDGKEFDTKKQCEMYEKEQLFLKKEKSVNMLKLSYDLLPLTLYDDWRECDVDWYRIENETQYNTLKEYYELKGSGTEYFSAPESYPATICVTDYEEYAETYYLDTLIEVTKKYFSTFGLNVTIN